VLLTDYFNLIPIAISLGYRVVQRSVKSNFIDEAETCGTDTKAYPAILLYIVEFLRKQVYIESTLGTTLRLGNVVANHGFLSCDLTNFRHCYLLFLVAY